jgi:NADH-quinone oxidoreductase subunit N
MPLADININFNAILPEIFLTVVGLAVLLLDFFLPKKNKFVLGIISIGGLFILLPLVLFTSGSKPSFGSMVLSDHFSAFFKIIIILAGILVILISMDYLKKMKIYSGEYYYIILFATLGMMVMVSSNDLLNLYVGLELMALSFYILVALRVHESRSVEGALKYFVLGTLSSGILLYGISFAYGFSGSTNLIEIAKMAARASAQNPFLLLAMALIVVGFSFKVALFPFHIWAPDAYEGAPTPITALLSVGSKTAAFAVFLRVFIVAFPAYQPQWSKLLWILSAATMIFGSVVAISQKNIIRMLAYSSIAHAGFIIIGLLVYNQTGVSGILFYLLVYIFMNMGAFAIVTLLAKNNGSGEQISDYRGLASRHPLLAFSMTLFLLSLAGVPPTGGFAAKFIILASAIDAHYYWLAVIGVVAAAIALFFYAKIIFYMYMKESPGDIEIQKTGLAYRLVFFITATATLILGLYPAPFIEMGVNAIKPLLM